MLSFHGLQLKLMGLLIESGGRKLISELACRIIHHPMFVFRVAAIDIEWLPWSAEALGLGETLIGLCIALKREERCPQSTLMTALKICMSISH